jgi:transcription elongation factor GreA
MVKISKENYEKLKKELEYLEKEKRKEIAEKLKIAASHGDLSENAEYALAKEEQANLEQKILEIKKILETAQIIEKNKNDIVDIGSKVEILDLNTNKKINIEIVGYGEVDPIKGKISENSPLGKNLINKKVGDNIEFEINGKKFKYKILKIY